MALVGIGLKFCKRGIAEMTKIIDKPLLNKDLNKFKTVRSVTILSVNCQ